MKESRCSMVLGNLSFVVAWCTSSLRSRLCSRRTGLISFRLSSIGVLRGLRIKDGRDTADLYQGPLRGG